jgi:hypothetical protein
LFTVKIIAKDDILDKETMFYQGDTLYEEDFEDITQIKFEDFIGTGGIVEIYNSKNNTKLVYEL